MHVVVVGGGIVGLSCAHALAERDIEVTLCESGSIGGESTQRSAGGIRTQFATRVNVDLSLASLDVWNEFEERFGVDIAHRKTGYLFLAREADTAAGFEENVALQNERGGRSEYLDPSEATAYAPGIHPEKFVAATYSPLDGFADPNLAAQGYSQALGDGVTVLTKTPVEDVLVDSGTVRGVETPDERIEADAVVDAAGAWAGELSAMAGVSLPIEPKRRQILVANPEIPVPEDAPLTIDLDTGLYFRPEREGQAIVGGHFGDADPTQDPGGYDKTMDFDWATTALENASGWTDHFGPETTVKRGWAGLYAVTPDHHPIIEEVLPGLVVAAGFSGHGFQHAPATGQLVAEIVHDGEPSLVDIGVLGRDRFEEGGLREETNVA
ncbi:NAD(P)/FAD-dependent oxidoreductase [Halococcus sediminicola]|uniref:NAD(P)/FAD-dependent oxidoreductase n=1 Tax=Halococcus sediminicola TaxID=1264579 RepID=UPI0006784315|nr:FAD-dependent oxidoreductase [Halococcus sediminicola]